MGHEEGRIIGHEGGCIVFLNGDADEVEKLEERDCAIPVEEISKGIQFEPVEACHFQETRKIRPSNFLAPLQFMLSHAEQLPQLDPAFFQELDEAAHTRQESGDLSIDAVGPYALLQLFDIH